MDKKMNYPAASGRGIGLEPAAEPRGIKPVHSAAFAECASELARSAHCSARIKILLVEDDSDFVFLIRKMINQDDRLEFSGCADSRAEGVELAKKTLPEIVLMDLNLSKSELDGIEAAREIRLSTNAKVLLLTSFEQPEIITSASKKAFASGYIFKSQCQTLTDTIHKTATSITPQAQLIKELILQDLSHAERGVLSMLMGENNNVQSAIKTVANQKTNIFKKLGLKSTNELIHIMGNW